MVKALTLLISDTSLCVKTTFLTVLYQTCVFFCYTYISFGWCIVEPSRVKRIVRVLNYLWGVEDGEDCAQCPSVPVICHTSSVVTLTGHVTEGIKRHFLQEQNTRIIKHEIEQQVSRGGENSFPCMCVCSLLLYVHEILKQETWLEFYYSHELE